MRLMAARSTFSSASATVTAVRTNNASSFMVATVTCLGRGLQSNCVKITISKENYVKTIAEAESEGETVIAATLTRWLNVSAPAVTMAIKRLKRDGLIRVGKEGQITL